MDHFIRKLFAGLAALIALLASGGGLAAAQPTTPTAPSPTPTVTQTPNPTPSVTSTPPSSAPAAPPHTSFPQLTTTPRTPLKLPGYSKGEANAYEQSGQSCAENLGVELGSLTNLVPGNFGPALACEQWAGFWHPIDRWATMLSTIAGGSGFWDDPTGSFARAVMEGNTQAFAYVMAFWTNWSVSVADPNQPYIGGIRNLTFDIQLFAFALGLGAAALRVAIARRHAVSEGADETAKVLLRTLFSLWTLPVIVIVIHQVGDAFSVWVLDQSTGEDLDQRINAIAKLDETTGLGPIMCLILALIGVLGSVAQLVALLLREALLALAVALAPIAAAASATGSGRQSWSNMIGLTVAALLFKPVASLIYAFALWASTDEDAVNAVSGVVLLAFAGLTLPALMRYITPAVATISAGGGQVASLMAAGAGAVGAVAGGAAMGLGAGKALSGAAPTRTTASGAGTPAASGAIGGGGAPTPKAGGSGVGGAGTAGGVAGPSGAQAGGSTGGHQPAGGTGAAGQAAGQEPRGRPSAGYGAVAAILADTALSGVSRGSAASNRGFSNLASFTGGMFDQVPR
ncbi:hypothetical protein ACIGO9_30710 [Nocardia asteroides]|uniref:hypothetical protein n=1 Tax=Nocardia asteroides TaxID=1824 RepID=UPI0037C9C8BD